MKHTGTLAVYHAKKKEQILYLEYSFLMIKLHIYPHNFNSFDFFKGESDQGIVQLVIEPIDISQTSRIVSLS